MTTRPPIRPAAAHRLSKPSSSDRDDESLEDGTTQTKPLREEQPDDRSPAQQRADALVLIAKFFLDHHESVTGTSIGRPHVNVTVDLDRLTSAHLTGDPDRPYSTSNVDLAAVLQDACDCSVTRILTAGPSIVLDIGRESRVIPVALRKAVIFRDKTCRHPAATCPHGSAMCTTSVTGSTAAKRAAKTACFCAEDITPPFTNMDGPSLVTQTTTSGSPTSTANDNDPDHPT